MKHHLDIPDIVVDDFFLYFVVKRMVGITVEHFVCAKLVTGLGGGTVLSLSSLATLLLVAAGLSQVVVLQFPLVTVIVWFS